MQVSNRDLFSTEATLARYQAISPLLIQPLFDDAFSRHDRAAITGKKQYHRFGRLAIILVALSAILTLAEALIFPNLFQNVILTYVAVSMAFIGITLQLYIICTKQKQKWLLNRFASELIRSLKFQSFALAYRAKNKTHLEELAQDHAALRMSNLENSLNTGLAILTEFSAAKALEKLKPNLIEKSTNMELAKTAGEAYEELRVDYQRNFARSEIETFRHRRRLLNSSQDMIYLAAAIFAFLSLGAKIMAYTGTIISTDWIDFTAVTLFVLGATEAIMDNAMLEEQSQARFEQYIRDIDDVRYTEKFTDGSSSGLPNYLHSMERVCMGELAEFCRAAEKISYRF